MSIGDLALKASTLLMVVAFVSAVRWARGREASERTFRFAYAGMTLGLAAASALLMAAILGHDFRYEYVIGYSSRDLPLIYLISAFWAGQEGTYLLWALVGALVGYALFRRTSWERAAVMAVYTPTVGFLLTLMLDPNGNPFRLAARVPPDGRGLNPLLQDPWMASHPPMVFLGYAAATVPAVLALVALFRKREDQWLLPALRWALVAFVLLGVGIIMGGFWAYKVLGWGGYWGWDPVENASLVPWLVVTALIHGLLVQRGVGALPRTNLVLALSSYLLVLYATFLTRSGVLADFSVHSFPAGTIYRLLVGIMVVALAVSVFALARRRGTEGRRVDMGLSWPFILSFAVVLFAVSATFVLVGTSWPILSSMAGKASVPGPPFYNRINLPLYVALCALLGVAPFLAWSKLPARSWLLRLVPSLAVAAAGTGAGLALGARGASALVLFFVALLALGSNLLRFVEVVRVRWLNTGAAVAHLGFALMFVGIVGSSAWGVNEKAELPLGRPVQVLDRILTYRGHVDGSEPQDRWRVAVLKPGGPETVADVWMFKTNEGSSNESILRRPAILRDPVGDLYVSPLGVEFNETAGGIIDLARDQPVSYRDATLTFLGFDTVSTDSGHGTTFWARVLLRRGGEEERVSLPFGADDAGDLLGRPVDLELLPGVRLAVTRVAVETARILAKLDDPTAGPSEVLTVDVSTKPLIGFLWAGTILLSFGCALAAARWTVDASALGAAERAALAGRSGAHRSASGNAAPASARRRPRRRRVRAGASH